MTATTERRWTDRRSKSTHFYFPERRTGFDRRLGGPLTWYRDRPAAIAIVLAVVGVLNILDLSLTDVILSRGGAEANPIMSALLEADPVLAALVKLGLTAAVISVIWWMRRYRYILAVSLVALAAYSGLVVYQVSLLVVIT